MTTLREAAKAVLDCWDSPKWGWAPSSPTADLMAVLRAALEQSDMGIPITEKQAEPVATVQCINGITIGYIEVMQPVGTKLYTSQPQRRPLTIKEINALPEAKGYWPMGMNDRIVRLIRAIEQAHGIGEKP